ncbi:uncharacterized protein LOC112082788 [Eutrema salsugineum]|uniref:uncharacterized protein LOC112082788 n=1 Tax=Eutrema salsugineum TaxID=72664 RepID=UPI000CECF502|nr:uncharacterized protein LOC112082788 [Eutrema salsugineum]
MGDGDGDIRVLKDGGREVTMMEVSEKDRPPDRLGSGSWAQKVSKGGVGGRLCPESVLDDVFVTERLVLEFPDGEGGEPVITIGTEVLEAMNGLWKQCMIVKVLGRNIPISNMSRKLKELWQPRGAMYVMDLPRQFFMVRFEVEAEYLAALTGGPWRAFGSYLMVQAWSPDFDPLSHDIVTTSVWVRLANLPVNFYHRSILMGIARGLGKPVKVDAMTLNFERARFTRVCVEVDLKKPLKGTVMVNGERYYVAYEGMSNICATCGLYGHLVHTCPNGRREEGAGSPKSTMVAEVTSNSQVGDGFTEVRGRRGGFAVNPNGMVFNVGSSGIDVEENIQRASGNIEMSNRFDGLEQDMTYLELREVNAVRGGEETNGKVEIPSREGKSAMQAKGGKFKQGANHESSSSKGIYQNTRMRGTKLAKSNTSHGGRSRSNMVAQPTRGLIFGPTRGEVTLSTSGKHLRVESGSVGRPGGRFESVEEAKKMEEVVTANLSTEVAVIMTEVEKEGNAMGIQSSVMEGGVYKHDGFSW